MDNTPNVTQTPTLREIQSHSTFTGGGLLIYLALFMGIQILAEVIGAVVLVIKDPGLARWDRFSEYYNSLMDLSMNGWVYIASLVIGLFVLYLYSRKRLPVKDVFVSPNKMTAGKFTAIFFIFFAAQAIGAVINIALELVLNLFGLSNSAVAELMDEIFNHPSMIIYAAIFGPIAEELVFRGFIMRRFQKWGKVFAIFMSSLFFGLFHMNFVQIPYAIIVGIVMAYTAMEYGIKWSILLHIINNGVFSCGIALLGKQIGDSKATVLELLFLGVCFVIGLFYFIKEFGHIADYIRHNRTKTPAYPASFSSWTIITLLVLTIGMAVFTLLSMDMLDVTAFTEK